MFGLSGHHGSGPWWHVASHLRGDTVRPSFRHNSAAMRSSPQVQFFLTISAMSRWTSVAMRVGPDDGTSGARRGERDLGATARVSRAGQSSRAHAIRRIETGGRVQFARRCLCGVVGSGVRCNTQAASRGTDSQLRFGASVDDCDAVFLRSTKCVRIHG